MVDVIVLKSIYGQPAGAITQINQSELAELKSGGFVKEIDTKINNNKKG